ncbi:Negative elongation factor B, partial [Fragariocoptes setiger]
MDMEPLEDSTIPGKQHLRDALTNCSDPLRTIEEFQLENGILLPSLRPMLPLLDLHGVKRLDFHQSVLEELKERLRQQTEVLGKSDNKQDHRKLQELLVRSFRFIKIPMLQPVVMAVLKNVNNLDNKILKMLVSDENIYHACDVSVKRQIWLEHQSLFGDEVSPLLQQYIQDKEHLIFNHMDTSVSFFSQTPKQRRQSPIIRKLVDMVGDNVMLYDTIVQFLRTLFLKTKNIHYCTLRVELLMALHDKEVQEITTMDQTHKFVWCLDACIREQAVDPKRSRELQTFLETIKKGQEHMLADVSMTLCDPYAVNFLASSAMRIISHLISNECLPREHNGLLLILRILNLGLHSWDIINSYVYREPKLDVKLITKFLPVMMSLMTDDLIRVLNTKLPSDSRESALAIIEHSGPPPEIFQKYIEKDRLAAVLAMQYVLNLVRVAKDKQAIMRILPALSSSAGNKALDNQMLHSFVCGLIAMPDNFSDYDFATIVINDFLMTNIRFANVASHLMKLLYHVKDYLPVAKLDDMVSSLTSLSKLMNPIGSLKMSELISVLRQSIEDRAEAKTPGDVEQADEQINKETEQLFDEE